MKTVAACLLIAFMAVGVSSAVARDWVEYPGGKGPGKGRHIVFLSGDEEYRSEEGLPMMAEILSQRHGFKCTVVFSVNPADGTIDPNNHENLPNLEAVRSADLVVMLWRFREPADAQLKYFADHYLAGKPIIALRTSTHAFSFDKNKQSAYAKYDWRSKEWPGGFGKQVFGETWVSHWGNHKKEATLGVIEAGSEKHPILRGVADVFGDTDVYEAWPPADAKILVRGQVLSGMKPTDPPASYRKKNVKGVEQGVNDPMMPVVWIRERTNEHGKVNRVLTTTMGSATDLQNPGLRRLLVNAAYWCVGLEKKIPKAANVDYLRPFHPTFYGFNEFQRGRKPSDYEAR